MNNNQWKKVTVTKLIGLVDVSHVCYMHIRDKGLFNVNTVNLFCVEQCMGLHKGIIFENEEKCPFYRSMF